MDQQDLKNVPFRFTTFEKVDIQKTMRFDGAVLMHSAVALAAYPQRVTERLFHWARVQPNRVFLAQRDNNHGWQRLTYAQACNAVQHIAQSLLDRGLNAERPLAILSENSIAQALIGLAAMHVGIPYAPISPPYSLRSTSFKRLQHCLNLLRPGLLFVEDGKKYEPALQSVVQGVEIVYVHNKPDFLSATNFETLKNTKPTTTIKEAFAKITGDTVAKILFTSGSTGIPKGVINTHANLCANWQQITQTFPFVKEELEILDWLPWSHTFGGNHNFGLVLYNGGSLYIDGGNPTPAGITKTVENLREIAPTLYFNVPKGFEELIPYLEKDEALCASFFSRLKLLFYAGAGLAQHVWDALEKLAADTLGKRIVIATGLGCTESSPAALFYYEPGGYAGLLGTPAPGLQLKLVPKYGKMEARFKGPNISPGYWRQPELVTSAFDEEGFFCTGDALKFVDDSNPNAGMIFDGRIAEDFKLSTGTWVNVGILRKKLIAAGGGLIQDVVLTGLNQSFVGAIVFLDLNHCKKIAALPEDTQLATLKRLPVIKNALQQILLALAKKSTGSASTIQKAIIADFTLTIDAGEITDKGSINQQAVLANRRAVVDLIYANKPDEQVIVI